MKLLPFTESAFTRSISLEATLRQTPKALHIEFIFKGGLERIRWPSTTQAARVDNLWKTTCLEAFISKDLEPLSPYLEINCSPAGDWNIYSLSAYRQGLTPSPEGHLKLQVKKSPQETRFTIDLLDLPMTDAFHAGLTAVIESTDGELSYWALSHESPEADFHNKASFKIQL